MAYPVFAMAPGQWAHVSEARVDTEVLINFIDNDINHPGTLSGMHSHGLDGSGYNQWQIDDTPHQLRMRLASSRQTSQLNLGHLIAQAPNTAQRGAYRGQGFELRSDAVQGCCSVARGRMPEVTAHSVMVK